MAQMIPRSLLGDEELVRRGLGRISSAERRVFEAFKYGLPDEYVVFHSRALQAPGRRGGVQDVELDFLVAHPELGLLVLEVKGGRIVVDGKSGRWVSVDRHGTPHEIKNPVEQVKGGMYALLELLRSDAVLRRYNMALWYGVALPDVDVVDGLGLDSPRAIIFDRADLLPDRVEAAVERTYAHYRRHGQAPLTTGGITALTTVLAPNWVLRPLTVTDIAVETASLIRLTEEQYDVLDGMEHKARALIAGCAGSGKTMLAVEKARRLGATGQRVLLTCFNKGLAGWLNETFDLPGVTIQTFHSLAKQTIESTTGRPMPMPDAVDMPEADFWATYVPNTLLEVCDDIPTAEKFDAIIVDEGQDFRREFWIPLQLLSKQPDSGVFYIFYDDSQRIYSDDAFPLGEIAFRLTKNLRSTYEIGEAVARYYRGSGAMRPAGPVSKRPPEIVRPRKGEPPEELLRRILDKLAAEQIPAGDIVLLTLHNRSSRWLHAMRVGDYTLVRTDRRLKARDIYTSTVYAFKGLERPVVILAEMEELDMTQHEDVLLVYVALSRAKNQVFVLGDLPALPALGVG
jgi:hypothetical protein